MAGAGEHEPREQVQERAIESVFGNAQTYDLFMLAVDQRATAAVGRRLESLRNWLVGIAGALVLIATALGGYVIDLMIDRAVKDSLDETVGIAQFDSQLAALNFRVLSMDLSESFSTEDAESVIRDIATLYAERTDLASRSKLSFAVETAVMNFVQANRTDLMVRLVDAVPVLADESAVILQTLIQVDGRTLLSDAGAPRSWIDEDGSMVTVYERYRAYADKAVVSGHPGLFLAFEMLLRHVEGREAEEIRNLVADSDNLNDQNGQIFVNLMVSLATDEVASRVADRVSAFLCEYGKNGELIGTVVENAARDC